MKEGNFGQSPSDAWARFAVDATGDGDVAFSAGAPFEQGRPSDGLVQPMSIMYRIAGVDETKGFSCGSEQEARTVRVPEGTWEEVVTRGQQTGELATTIGVVRLYRTQCPGERIVNATQVNAVDGTNVDDLTRAELEGRRQAYQVLDFVRKHAPGFEHAEIVMMPAVVGVRETRRFLGRAYLTRADLIQGRKWPNAVVRNASFPIDIHNPAGSGQAEGHEHSVQGTAAKVRPYDIPYSGLIPRETDGLLLAGCCISGSHDATPPTASSASPWLPAPPPTLRQLQQPNGASRLRWLMWESFNSCWRARRLRRNLPLSTRPRNYTRK